MSRLNIKKLLKRFYYSNEVDTDTDLTILCMFFIPVLQFISLLTILDHPINSIITIILGFIIFSMYITNERS